MEDCSPDQKKRMAVSFPLGKRMIQTARRVISSMKKGSEEEKLFMKYFGKDAFEHRWHIDRGYMDTLRAWDGSPSYRCVPQGTDPCEDSSTEGYTGAKALLTGHGIVMCENAFKHYPDDAIGLAEVIVHEEAHALDWDRDIEYCNHTTGCPLTTTQAEANADSYSAFAGAAFRQWG